jgi:hypothetical protein
LRAVGEIAELALPQHERIRLGLSNSHTRTP